jgi:hypothetical protein
MFRFNVPTTTEASVLLEGADVGVSTGSGTAGALVIVPLVARLPFGEVCFLLRGRGRFTLFFEVLASRVEVCMEDVVEGSKVRQLIPSSAGDSVTDGFVKTNDS